MTPLIPLYPFDACIRHLYVYLCVLPKCQEILLNPSVETLSPKSFLEKSNVPKTVRKCVSFVEPKIGRIAPLKNKMVELEKSESKIEKIEIVENKKEMKTPVKIQKNLSEKTFDTEDTKN